MSRNRPYSQIFCSLFVGAWVSTHLSPSRAVPPPPEYAIGYQDRIELMVDGKKSGTIEAQGAQGLSWSPNGQYLLSWKGSLSGEIEIFKIQPPGDGNELYSAVKVGPGPSNYGFSSLPTWSPDSLSVIGERKEGGILQVNLLKPAGPAQVILPVGSRPVWSPDSERIMFVSSGDDGGLWISDRNGNNSRRILSGAVFSGTWTPGGHALLYTTALPGNRLALVRSWIDNPKPSEIIDVDSPEFSLSPGSPYVVVHRKGSYCLFDLKNSSLTQLPDNTPSMPQWVGPRRLLSNSYRSAFLLEIMKNKLTATNVPQPAFDAKLSRELLSASKKVGLYLSANTFELSPFQNLLPPDRGQMRLEGSVSSVDPEDASLELLVNKVVYSNRSELNLSRPITKKLQLEGGVFGSGGRQVRLHNFVPDHEVALTVEEADINSELTSKILAAYIPSFAEEAADPIPVSKDHVSHPPLYPEYDGITRTPVTVPMIYPILGKHSSPDTFLASRGGGTRRHHGNDLMANKMRPLVATFDGRIYLRQSNRGNSGNDATLRGDNGFTTVYRHMNNDTPGSRNDGSNQWRYCFAPGLKSGDRVIQGQFIGYVGNSGNAESTGPHCHFELIDNVHDVILNPAFSLKAAQRIQVPTYRNPLPDFWPAIVNEERIDAEVVAVDLQAKRITVEVIARSKSGKMQPVTAPTQVVLSVNDKTTINFGRKAPRRIPLEQLRQGFWCAAIGRAGADGWIATSLFTELKG